MSRPLPPDDAATTVRPGGPVPPPVRATCRRGRSPAPSRRLGWGMLLGALVLLAAAGAGVAAYLATRDDGSNAADDLLLDAHEHARSSRRDGSSSPT